jgi:hypothetical protein
MVERKRKYYRAIVHRVPPYAAVNGSYDYEEDVYAFSKDGAIKSIEKYHSKGYGSDYVKEIREITKEEFKGNHKRN